VARTWILTGSPENLAASRSLADALEQVRKWPREHWKLAFQGQVRPISDDEARMLFERMNVAAGRHPARASLA
jgi:hypothetical protein